MEIGQRIQTLRQCFNIREGLSPAEVHLPGRSIGEPPVHSGPNKGRQVALDELRQMYWQVIGWDKRPASRCRRRCKPWTCRSSPTPPFGMKVKVIAPFPSGDWIRMMAGNERRQPGKRCARGCALNPARLLPVSSTAAGEESQHPKTGIPSLSYRIAGLNRVDKDSSGFYCSIPEWLFIAARRVMGKRRYRRGSAYGDLEPTSSNRS